MRGDKMSGKKLNKFLDTLDKNAEESSERYNAAMKKLRKILS